MAVPERVDVTLPELLGNRAMARLCYGERQASLEQIQCALDGPERAAAEVHAAAERATRGPSVGLPHLRQIQASFGRHDVSHVRAFTDDAARSGAAAMAARAFASGERVAFARQPDLFLAAHEAAHVVQQRAGVRLTDGVGRSGDRYERQADEAARRVVRGESAEAVLGRPVAPAAAGGAATPVQRFLESQGARTIFTDGDQQAKLDYIKGKLRSYLALSAAEQRTKLRAARTKLYAIDEATGDLLSRAAMEMIRDGESRVFTMVSGAHETAYDEERRSGGGMARMRR